MNNKIIFPIASKPRFRYNSVVSALYESSELALDDLNHKEFDLSSRLEFSMLVGSSVESVINRYGFASPLDAIISVVKDDIEKFKSHRNDVRRTTSKAVPFFKYVGPVDRRMVGKKECDVIRLHAEQVILLRKLDAANIAVGYTDSEESPIYIVDLDTDKSISLSVMDTSLDFDTRTSTFIMDGSVPFIHMTNDRFVHSLRSSKYGGDKITETIWTAVDYSPALDITTHLRAIESVDVLGLDTDLKYAVETLSNVVSLLQSDTKGRMKAATKLLDIVRPVFHKYLRERNWEVSKTVAVHAVLLTDLLLNLRPEDVFTKDELIIHYKVSKDVYVRVKYDLNTLAQLNRKYLVDELGRV